MTRRLFLFLLLFLSTFFCAFCQEIDFSKSSGPVKPVNGVGQPPVTGYADTSLFHYLKEAGIPFSRLHDVGGAYGRNIYVDIPNLFRDFSKDENLEENYDFTFTDSLLVGLHRNGVEPYFRLGVTIENSSFVRAYRVFPPSDYAKWARVAAHVIMHYNQGWANGYHMGITHWEIWNEPENDPDPSRNPMWMAPFDTYMDFYGVVAPYLKKNFPEVKIGGYGSCGFYAITGEGVKAANASERNGHFVDCFLMFLERAKKQGWPLDFFSCHSYADVGDALFQFAYARKTLDAYGFASTELSVNEWLPNPSKEKLGTARQAAEIASGLIGFENGVVDDAEIYDARATGGTYAPLFHPETYKPRKAYYSFVAFNALRELGHAVSAPSTPDGVYVALASDLKGKAAVLVSNISSSDWRMPYTWKGYKVSDSRIIDRGHDLSSFFFSGIVPKDSVVLLQLSRD